MYMRRIFTFALSLAAILLTVLLVSCATATDPAELYKGESAEQIYQRGETAVRAHNYAEAVKRFEALEVQYPIFPQIETAQLHLIYAYYMKEDYPLATAAADRFIRIHPANPHVDYAIYLRGLANYYQNLGALERIFAVDLAKRDLTQIRSAFADFSDIVMRFPGSLYAPSAYQYMIYLRNLLANHQYEVADYYYQRKAYIAAIARASIVVKNYQGAPVVPKALVLMVKSYRQLQLPGPEQDTLSVLEYNFPNSKFVQQARS